ncbi:hypothetical protein QAD02_005420 [Eretmocerus hayati]|uniref:Uncharacterized protein n=1 Tax=Eretmocerus hayati TaxID=131215 RepID=A0ACC2NTG9_9HYME|nr:hypothetical protein QAD02_005420 [Eretmocerus hayati]
MSSYFANSYIPDLRNGGVEHPHQHQQHYGAAVQVPQQSVQQSVQQQQAQSVQQGVQQPQQPSDPCDPTMLRGGGVHAHYGATAAGQPQPGMPYPRFPPYDRMDIRNAAYYQQQDQHGPGGAGGMDMAGYRAGSPSAAAAMVGHMGHAATPVNGHPGTPIVYASCKLQAAAVDHQGSVLDGPDSPPLVDAQMHHQMHTQHAAHMQAQQQSSVQQQPGTPQSAPASNLPSPLYPWMRSQFGEFQIMFFGAVFMDGGIDMSRGVAWIGSLARFDAAKYKARCKLRWMHWEPSALRRPLAIVDAQQTSLSEV